MTPPADRVPTARFAVKRCDTERLPDAEPTHSVFLVPLTADYDSEDDDDPVADVIFEVNQSAIPSDLVFVDNRAEHTGEHKEEGAWLEVPEPIEPGTVVDLQLHIVGVPA